MNIFYLNLKQLIQCIFWQYSDVWRDTVDNVFRRSCPGPHLAQGDPGPLLVCGSPPVTDTG